MEDLLYPLHDLFFRHGPSMRARSPTSKLYLRLAGAPVGGRTIQAMLGAVGFRDPSTSFAPPGRTEPLGWTTPGSNSEPLACVGILMVCWRILKLANSLDTRTSGRRCSSRPYRKS